MRKAMRYSLLMLFACVTAYGAAAQKDTLLHRIVLIGDAGKFTGGQHPELALAKTLMSTTDSSTTVLYLGDNIYNTGLPDSGSVNYGAKRRILDSQVDLVRGTTARGIFIPGNHDWMKGRSKGLRQVNNQSEYIRSLGLSNVQFLPESGCPGPVEVMLDSQVVLVVVDSQWWLQRENRPGATSDCDCKTEDEVVLALKDLVYRHRDRLLVFAAHHPFKTYGPHGGYYTIKQHVFPLTDANPYLYIPFPVIGSIYPLARQWFGNIQDLKHPAYEKMIREIDTVLSTHPYCIRVSGHEHALQLITQKGQNYIVSGAASKKTRAKNGNGTQYADEGPGFGVIDISAANRVSVHFFSARSAQSGHLLHSASLKSLVAGGPVQAKDEATTSFPDSITVNKYGYYRAGPFKKWLFGENYREEWTTPVKVRVFDMGKEKGGLVPTRRGGGLQSRSIRLEDRDGKEYVLRSVEKYPDRTLPEEFRTTFAKDVVVDGISASYPFGSLSVPPLAQAAGIPHVVPDLVYLPNDPGLKQYGPDFADNLYFFEEREPGRLKGYSSAKVVENLQEDNDDEVDQRAVLKGRLLDMFIMDFDRHEDQWRWGAVDKDKGKRYFPVPRDRDQAFFTNTGVIPYIVSLPWLIPKFQGFRAKARNIRRFNFNARFFDRSFLNGLSEKEWSDEADLLLSSLTDSVIDAALQQQPQSIRSMSALRIAETLKERRRYLKQEALEYYRFLAREVDVAGSDKKEIFDISRNTDGSVAVAMYKINKEGERSAKLFERRFEGSLTKEVRLWGMGGEDKFELHGDAGKTILVRLIGGRGNDTIVNNAAGTAAGKTIVYDLSTESNAITGQGSSKDKRSASADVNYFDRRSYRYNILAPGLSVAFNPDDGVYLGAFLKYTTHGFRKEPFKVMHHLRANHALATNAYSFRYDMQATDVVGNLDLVLNLFSKAPDNTQNFFGLGNETVFDRSEGKKIRYYRSRFNLIDAAAFLRYNPLDNVSIMAGPVIQYYTIDREDNKNRFLSFPSLNGLDSSTLYRSKTYTGAQLILGYDGRDNTIIPARGINWQNSIRYNKALHGNGKDFTAINSDLSMYLSFSAPAEVVIALRLGGGLNIGSYQFYQAQYLSGTENLRGFRRYRFAGDKMMYNNIDVRVTVGEFQGYLFPASVGVLAFHDIGRVWVKNERSDSWHTGWGGGVWLAPASRYVLSACYAYSKDGGLPFISLGFQF